MRWKSTSGDSRTALSRRRAALCARGPRRFAELLALLALASCTSDGSIGSFGRSEPAPPALPVHPQNVWATDGRALYALDVHASVFSPPVYLRGCDLNVVEIALDESGAMYAAGWDGSGSAALYSVSTATGGCMVVSRFDAEASWSLGFAGDRLFGYQPEALVRVDSKSGMKTVVAAIPRSNRESCDLVLRSDGTAWASTLLDRTSPTPENVIEEVDLETGQILARYALPRGVVIEGLAESSGVLYGFGRDGRVSRILLGDTTLLEPVPTTGGPPRFTGAASTTTPAPR